METDNKIALGALICSIVAVVVSIAPPLYHKYSDKTELKISIAEKGKVIVRYMGNCIDSTGKSLCPFLDSSSGLRHCKPKQKMKNDNYLITVPIDIYNSGKKDGFLYDFKIEMNSNNVLYSDFEVYQTDKVNSKGELEMNSLLYNWIYIPAEKHRSLLIAFRSDLNNIMKDPFISYCKKDNKATTKLTIKIFTNESEEPVMKTLLFNIQEPIGMKGMKSWAYRAGALPKCDQYK